jgi:hypothetical protein
MRIGISTSFTGAASGHLRTAQNSLSAEEVQALRRAMQNREICLVVLDSPWFQANREELDGHIVIHSGIHSSGGELHLTLQLFPPSDPPSFGHLPVEYSPVHRQFVSHAKDVPFIASNRFAAAKEILWADWGEIALT